MQVIKTLFWFSVARSVPIEGKVHGSTAIDSDLTMLDVVDAASGTGDSAASGCVSAFLHTDGV